MEQLNDIEVKNVLLDLMLKFDSVCRNNNISYSLGFGTLLGAVRHRGFIPWDDDIDIIMVRSEFERFVECCKFERDNFSLLYICNTDKYSLPLAKIIDKNTVLKQFNHRNGAELGVYIDIFILDNIPNNNIQKISQRIHLNILQKMWSLAEYRPETRKGLVKWLSKTLFNNKAHSIAFKMECISRRYAGITQNQEVGILSYSVYGRNREIYPRNYVKSYTNLTFENHEFMAFSSYDEMLTQLYGDYMKLPPAEKRVTHHEYTVEWRRT